MIPHLMPFGSLGEHLSHTMGLSGSGTVVVVAIGAGVVLSVAVSSTVRSRVSAVGADDAPQAETSKAPMRRNGAMKRRRICS